MALYEMTQSAFRALDGATFSDMNVKERDDLQRLLRTQIDVLGDDLFVLAEEFGDWEDSRRRIDLLAIDAQANLVVIELKRTSDGGHMELQALRYAAMVSAMTFERAVSIHSAFLRSLGRDEEKAETLILEFLSWAEPDEESFGTDVRILLVSEGFGRELTTAVLWLRERDIDIRCVRLHPYSDNGSRFVDVQQIIPLPEVIDYQIQLKEKGKVTRKNKAERYQILLKFWTGVVGIAKREGTRHGNRTPGTYHWLGGSSGIRGLGFNYNIQQFSATVELYIDRGDGEENLKVFEQILAHREQINQVFGHDIDFARLDGKKACRILYDLKDGGYKSPEADWPVIQEKMVKAMTRLELALQPILDDLQI